MSKTRLKDAIYAFHYINRNSTGSTFLPPEN